MTYLEILKEVKKRIVRQQITYEFYDFVQLYICIAITDIVADADYPTFKKGGDLKEWISEMLGSHKSLHSWLQANVDPNVTPKQSNAHRILWLDKLIAEYENESH